MCRRAHRGHRVHDRGGAGDGGERQAAADRLARDEQVRGDAVVVLDRPHLSRPADAGLHLVVDVEDPVLVAELQQAQQVVARHRQEAALPLHRLEHAQATVAGSTSALKSCFSPAIASSVVIPR